MEEELKKACTTLCEISESEWLHSLQVDNFVAYLQINALCNLAEAILRERFNSEQ